MKTSKECSVPRQPNPQNTKHQENSRSSLPFSFSPCSLIMSTTRCLRDVGTEGHPGAEDLQHRIGFGTNFADESVDFQSNASSR
jgi:hypothetical protein